MTVTTVQCSSGQPCQAPESTSKTLDGAYLDGPREVGATVSGIGLTFDQVDLNPLLPATPAQGTSIRVEVTFTAKATNYLGGIATSPAISLTSTAGIHTPPRPCPNFILSWSWAATDYTRSGEFTDAPQCRSGTGARVASTTIRLQFPPGTWTGQSVTVTHRGVTTGMVNGSSSSAFNGLDPADEWKVAWGGNVKIHPIGIQLIVTTN